MSLFPSFMFPNAINIRLCNDVIGREGGASPSPGGQVAAMASVQDKGSMWDASRNATVSRYRVSFQTDPNSLLTRPLRNGDQVEWGSLIMTVDSPAVLRGGLAGFPYRIDCSYVKS